MKFDMKDIFTAIRLGREFYEASLICGFTRDDDYAMSERIKKVQEVLDEIHAAFPPQQAPEVDTQKAA